MRSRSREKPSLSIEPGLRFCSSTSAPAISCSQLRARPSLVARIDHGGILAAVEPDEIAALALRRGIVAAGEVALGPLDLDDMGAGIGQA